MTDNQELDNLNRIASDSWYARGVNSRTVEYSFNIFSKHLREGNILELGPAEGVMTALLAPLSGKLTVVEGSTLFCENLRQRFPAISVINSLFEDFNPDEKFDNIILGHVLEHVINPLAILQLAKTWLRSDGRVLAAVPNAHSLHRQAAVLMELLPCEGAMNEADLHHGHRRVFNPDTFRELFIQAGFQIDRFGGYWLKPVSNRQIEETWTPAMLDAFMRLGESYPDIAGEIYVIGTGGENEPSGL